MVIIEKLYITDSHCRHTLPEASLYAQKKAYDIRVFSSIIGSHRYRWRAEVMYISNAYITYTAIIACTPYNTYLADMASSANITYTHDMQLPHSSPYMRVRRTHHAEAHTSTLQTVSTSTLHTLRDFCKLQDMHYHYIRYTQHTPCTYLAI